MCGIMGYYAFSKTTPDKEKITTMFSLLESRGRDASGYAFIRDNNLVVNKAPIKSSEMIKTKEWEELELPKIFIAHTRMKTQGSEKNNLNNHPLYSKSIAIVHNGIVLNDKEIFSKKQRFGEVDSEAILAILSANKKGDKIKRLFDLIEGSFAVAVIDKNNPDLLTLIKKDNPIELYLDTKNDILYFCSEREIMQEALGITSETKYGFNLGERNFHHYTMDNNYVLTINSDGVDTYKKYTPKGYSWYTRDNLTARRINNSTDDFVECPWCLNLTRYYGEGTINYCDVCGNNLDMEDII